MKILHIIPNLMKGGAERICLDMVNELKKDEALTVELVLLSGVNEYQIDYPDIVPKVVNSFVNPSIMGKWKVDIAEFETFVKYFKPDIIHTHLFEADFFAHYNPHSSIKYITHCHDQMPQLDKLKWEELFVKKRLTETYERNFIVNKYKEVNNHFITISNDIHNHIGKELPPELRSKIHLLHNAIDVKRFENNGTKRSNSPIRLINVGSFIERKNQQFLIDVLVELNLMDVSCELELLGDGEMKNKVINYSKEKGVFDQVSFLGKVSNVENYLKQADVYVHSAISEPFGLVLLEAMASKLPVVSLKAGGNEEIIENGVNGYLINQGDVNSFAKKVAEMTKDREYLINMSEQAYNYVKDFSIEKYAVKLKGLYKKMLSC